jgi:putative two-component system response regulator
MKLVLSRRGGLSDGSRSRLHWAVTAAAGGVLLVLLACSVFAVIWFTGGLPNPYANLNYPIIALGAYLAGWRGGIAVALFAAYLLGPHAAAAGLPGHNDLDDWIVRTLTYLLVGGLMGALFDRSRASLTETTQALHDALEWRRSAIVTLARAAEAKDEDTADHLVRMRHLTEQLARAAGLNREEAGQLGWAAILHDVGKLHIPDAILQKAGPLSASERAEMERHPLYGEQILGDGAGLGMARQIARWHHENYDGSGYPDGLVGEAIPLGARIVRVVDAFDAMTHDRPYRPAGSTGEALRELQREAGRAFDPHLVRLLTDLVGNAAKAEPVKPNETPRSWYY